MRNNLKLLHSELSALEFHEVYPATAGLAGYTTGWDSHPAPKTNRNYYKPKTAIVKPIMIEYNENYADESS